MPPQRDSPQLLIVKLRLHFDQLRLHSDQLLPQRDLLLGWPYWPLMSRYLSAGLPNIPG
jgi:hypothetical protein